MYTIKYLINLDKYLDNAPTHEKRKIVKSLMYLKEFGLKPEIIDLKKLQGYDFWEVRIIGKDNTRIFCSQRGSKVYILHIFKKKSNKTSNRDLVFGQKQLLKIDKYI